MPIKKKGNQRTSERVDNILVLYTKEGETADALIEALVYKLVNDNNKNRVIVATSDWDEQRLVLGKGASRFSARELRLVIAEFKQQLRETYIKDQLPRNVLGSLLDPITAKKLEEIRKEKYTNKRQP